ncbi:uncharacterized protein C5orf34 homolog isoform X2 [Erinaceus europaeus]|uniref:Uncharacterized protein C5orf34 homolog isoform X2 n=1 Tax=Erinaceus europaeus TaxID=9365 RepID=A0ABM3XDT7_ERIEU|nr:uncharacterized protein C5orf34 homolog isoform X2 [Erinaceus europaeus]
MAAEVQMILYEDDSVQVQYVDGSRLQLSPCGSEFVFEKAPSVSAHPLEQPERIRQRTHFVISTYREQLQRALVFRNAFAACPFLSESIIPSGRQKHVLIDFSEVRWPSLDSDDGMRTMQNGAVKVSSVDGHAHLCLPRSQHEFTVTFLCKVSQKPDSTVALSEQSHQAKKEKAIREASKLSMSGSFTGQRLEGKENACDCQVMTSRELSEKSSLKGPVGREKLQTAGMKRTCTYTWLKQRCSVASCPEQWKYPLSLARRFCNNNSVAGLEADVPQCRPSTSDGSHERGKEISVLPKALPLSCPAPHLHRWHFCESLSQRQSDEEYTYPELVKVVWYKGTTYRLTHQHVNSIEIHPGDGSVFKSEGAYFGNYFTYHSVQEGSEEKEEKMYSVNSLPPDKPGSQFSVCSLIKQATRILQHCAKIRLSLSHNYHVCCWKKVSEISGSSVLPLLLRESFIPTTGKFLAYSDDKVHAVFLDGITLTLNWNFSSPEKGQVNRGLNLGWCKLTFPDGQDQLIQIDHPGPYERYVAAVVSWCRLVHTNQRGVPAQPPCPVLEENWSVASELEKIKEFNLLLENSGLLNEAPDKNKCSDHQKADSSETSLEGVNEKAVLVALRKTSEILQDIDCLLASSKK